MKSYKTKRAIGNAIGYIILILISIIWLFPFVGLVLQSFRSYATEYGGMVDYLVPKHFSLDNYKFLFDSSQTNYLLWYKNTIIIAIFVSLFQTIIQLCVSYALSRMRFAGRTFLMRFWLILGMFPGFLTMICLYFLLKQFGLTQAGAIPGLILVSVASCGMGYYVCKGYFDTIPKALDEAAMIDGANRWQRMIHITLPGIRGTIVTLLIMNLGKLMGSNYERLDVFGNTQVKDFQYQLAIYIYQVGLASGKYSRSTAVGLFQSLVGLCLVLISDRIAKLLGEDGLI